MEPMDATLHSKLRSPIRTTPDITNINVSGHLIQSSSQWLLSNPPMTPGGPSTHTNPTLIQSTLITLDGHSRGPTALHPMDHTSSRSTDMLITPRIHITKRTIVEDPRLSQIIIVQGHHRVSDLLSTRQWADSITSLEQVRLIWRLP